MVGAAHSRPYILSRYNEKNTDCVYVAGEEERIAAAVSKRCRIQMDGNMLNI